MRGRVLGAGIAAGLARVDRRVDRHRLGRAGREDEHGERGRDTHDGPAERPHVPMMRAASPVQSTDEWIGLERLNWGLIREV